MLLPNLNLSQIINLHKTPKKPTIQKPNLIKILPNLYISDYASIKDQKILKKNKISIIFNLTKKNCQKTQKNFKYENFNIRDNGNINNKSLFKKIIKKIFFYKQKNKRIVIHCYKCISRAPTLVIGYLMIYEKFSFEKAFDFVKGKKNDIDPNVGFLIQLMEICN